jgi:hypothetical protein
MHSKLVIRREVEVERRVLTRCQGDVRDKGENYSREVIWLPFENGVESDFREVEECNHVNHDVSCEVKKIGHILE